jgi:hypothetical protein
MKKLMRMTMLSMALGAMVNGLAMAGAIPLPSKKPTIPALPPVGNCATVTSQGIAGCAGGVVEVEVCNTTSYVSQVTICMSDLATTKSETCKSGWTYGPNPMGQMGCNQVVGGGNSFPGGISGTAADVDEFAALGDNEN